MCSEVNRGALSLVCLSCTSIVLGVRLRVRACAAGFMYVTSALRSVSCMSPRPCSLSAVLVFRLGGGLHGRALFWLVAGTYTHEAGCFVHVVVHLICLVVSFGFVSARLWAAVSFTVLLFCFVLVCPLVRCGFVWVHLCHGFVAFGFAWQCFVLASDAFRLCLEALWLGCLVGFVLALGF